MREVMTDDTDPPSDRVATRWVIYISGFDPRGASFYHGLFKREVAKHAEKHGIAVGVGKRKRQGTLWQEWTATTPAEGHAGSVRVLFLGWDDIIRRHWTKSRPALFFKALGTYLALIRTGTLSRCFRLTWYPLVAVLFPAFALVALYLALMLGLGAAVVGLALAVFGATTTAATLAGTMGALAGAALAHRLSPLLQGGWLVRIFCFCRLLAERPLPELDERLDRQVEDLLCRLKNEQPDELLVVAHSVGSIVAFPLVDRLLKSDTWQGRVNLLTLGSCIPLSSFMQAPDGWFNTILRRVATHPHLDWIDFTMPSDGACVALVDPVRATFDNAVTYPQPDLPKFLSARFMEGYSKDRYKELKKNRYLYHFQYLMTPDRPAAYDFQAIILGDQRLPARFRTRKNQALNPAP